MTITPEQIARWRKLRAEATSGECFCEDTCVFCEGNGERRIAECYAGPNHNEQAYANAAFIAAAANHWDELLDEVERLRTRVERLTDINRALNLERTIYAELEAENVTLRARMAEYDSIDQERAELNRTHKAFRDTYEENERLRAEVQRLVGADIREAVMQKQVVVWSDDKARSVIDEFSESGLPLYEFAASFGMSEVNLRKRLTQSAPEAYEAAMEARREVYRVGRKFEYDVRKYLVSLGYVCMVSPRSLGPADLMAAKRGTILLIQCKSAGRIRAAERQSLWQCAHAAGGIPVVATRSAFIVFMRLTNCKKHSRLTRYAP